jgi:hypothetical protein
MMATDGHGWPQMATDGHRWPQMATDGLRTCAPSRLPLSFRWRDAHDNLVAYTYTAQLKPKGTLHFTIRLGPPVTISDRCTSGKATKSSRSQKDRSGASSDPFGNAIEYMEEAVEDAHKRILRTAVETRDTGAATLLDLEKQRHQMEVSSRA